jgi:hypothetical protein
LTDQFALTRFPGSNPEARPLANFGNLCSPKPGDHRGRIGIIHQIAINLRNLGFTWALTLCLSAGCSVLPRADDSQAETELDGPPAPAGGGPRDHLNRARHQVAMKNQQRQRNHVRSIVRSVLSSRYEIEEAVRDSEMGDSFLVRRRSSLEDEPDPPPEHSTGLGSNGDEKDSFLPRNLQSANDGIVHVGRTPQGMVISLNLFDALTSPEEANDGLLRQVSFEDFGHTPPPPTESHSPTGDTLETNINSQAWSPPRSISAEQDLLDDIQTRLRLGLCLDRSEDSVWKARYHNLATRVYRDHEHFYSRESLSLLGVGLGVAAILANSQADRDISDAYQEEIRGGSTDEVARIFKQVGDGTKTFPVFAGAVLYGTLAGRVHGAEDVGEWGWRCMRTFVVGGLPLLLIQRVTGADRPGMSNHDSRWVPFRAEKGASGHAFMGAIPFITAAKMTDEPLLRAGFYLGSTLTGLSRLNDNDHYFSQIMLGWLVAYVAASAVDETEFEVRSYQIIALPMADGMGLGIEFRK